MNAQLILEPDEWKAAYILNQQKAPSEPDVKTIWLGMQRILDFAAGIRFYKELQAAGSCV